MQARNSAVLRIIALWITTPTGGSHREMLKDVGSMLQRGWLHARQAESLGLPQVLSVGVECRVIA